MAAKRPSSRSASVSGGPPASSGGGPGPLVNAAVVTAALGFGLTQLVDRGKVSWPPNQLLANGFTVAGCLAMVGPIVLSRKDSGEGGVGELVWMTGGLLVWVFDAVALLRGDLRTSALATPLGAQAMGLTILAVLLAGWRCRVSGRGWSWTNVTGWVLGLFWVGMALSTVWPPRVGGMASR